MDAVGLLSSITPNTAVILLILGGLLICFEFHAPGTVVPGSVGLFLVLFSLSVFDRMGVRWSAMALLGLALLLLVFEAKLQSYGVLGIAGITALVFGLGHLVATQDPARQVSPGLALGAGLGFGSIVCGLIVLGERARREKVRLGADAMVGHYGVVQKELGGAGQILVRGEIWSARSAEGTTLSPGTSVRVVARMGLALLVEPASDTARERVEG